MKGIRKQGKNSWQIQIYTGTGLDGKPKRQFVTVHGSKGDAEKRRNELLVSLAKGVPVPVNRRTVADQLRDWVNGAARAKAGPRTIEGYQSIIDRHLIPALGHLQLKDLQPAMIERYYGEACNRLSTRTVHHHHRVLSKCLKHAVRLGYLGRNPCELVEGPSPSGKKMRYMNKAEVGHLLDLALESPYYPVIYAAINTGMRQAELLGLRWRDVDLERCSISVSQVLYKRRGVCTFKEPKTKRSRRTVSMTPKLASYLRTYRAQCQAYRIAVEKPLTEDDLVFTTITGEPIDPSGLSHEFHKMAERAGMAGVRFHDLRHSFASIMLKQGAKPKVISEALGHASVGFTMDVYADIIDGMQEEAMALLNDALPAGVSAANNAELTRLSANSTLTGV